jgi:hypothetical protein
LPVELILEVACHLSGDWAFSTLANLNVTSRALHERTLPILYETIVWDDRRKDLYGFLFFEAGWARLWELFEGS